MSAIWAGKQKAWIGAFVAFAASLAMQTLGAGDGPSAAEIDTLASLTSEIVSSAILAGITGAAVYFKKNVEG